MKGTFFSICLFFLISINGTTTYLRDASCTYFVANKTAHLEIEEPFQLIQYDLTNKEGIISLKFFQITKAFVFNMMNLSEAPSEYFSIDTELEGEDAFEEFATEDQSNEAVKLFLKRINFSFKSKIKLF